MLEKLKFNKSFLAFIIYFSDIIASIETEINIPSFPDMLMHFDTTESYLQWIVSSNFLGICIGSLFYGPLADRFGRKWPLIFGYIIFSISSILCAVSLDNLELLILARFFQGIGLSSIFVIGITIIFDIFDKEQATKCVAIQSCIVTIGMAISPIVGSFITLSFGWKYNFYLIAVLATLTLILKLMFLWETHNYNNEAKYSISKILHEYYLVSTDHISIGNLAIISCIFCAYIVYITNLSLIFVKYLNVSQLVYGYYQSFTLIIYAIFTFFIGNFIKFFGYGTTRSIGIYISLVGSIILFLIAVFFPNNPLLISFAMGIISIGHAFILSIAFSDYMDANQNRKGVASAFSSCVRLMIPSFGIYISGIFFNGTIMPVAITILLMGVISTFVYILIYRNTRLAY